MTTHTPEGLREAAKKAGCRIVYDGVRHFISYAPRGWILNECHSTEEDAWQACERYVAKDPAILAALPPNSREQEGVDRIAVAFAVANGFTEGNEHYLEASPAQRQRYDFVVDALIEEGFVSAPSPAEPAKGSGELEPCPLCGSPGEFWKRADGAWGAICDNCGCEVSSPDTTKAGALAAWNRPTGSEVPQGRKVPDGWKLMPIEPTMEMTTFGETNAEDAYNEFHKTILRVCGCPGCDEAAHEAFSAIYRAMIAAAPPPEGRG